MSPFTYHDFAGSLAAVAGFALVLAGPGYVAGWVTNVLGFRKRTLAERLAWSLPLSVMLTTMVAVMVGKYGSLNLACWVVFGAGLFAAGMVGVEVVRGGGHRLGRSGWLVLGTAVGVTLFVIGELVDIGIGNKLYMSVTVYDHALRTAFVDAVVRTGVPPGNPLYWTVGSDGVGHAPAMRYYYFWYVVCALVVKVVGVSARQVIVASCVWAGFGLVSVIALYERHFLQASVGSTVRRRTWVAVGLLGVTGLDILPAIARYLQGDPTDPDMEWWSRGQVTSWIDTMLWVPHHLAALVCCVFGFLLVWMSVGRGWRQRVLCGVLAGIGFAASFGLSTYVAVAFAMTMVIWMPWAMRSATGRSRSVALLIAGLVAVVVLMPYLAELRAAGPNSGNKTRVFAVSVRQMVDPDAVLGVPGFMRLKAFNQRAEEELAALVLLAPGYAAELGFFGAALLLIGWRWRRIHGEGERAAVFLTLVGLVVSSLVRSTVIGTNDFGIRSMLVPQFFLLLLAGMLLDGTMPTPRRWVKLALSIALVVGVAGTVYQVVLLRFYLPAEDHLNRQGLGGLAERTMALRTVVRDLELRSPKAAVMQYDTQRTSEYFNYARLLNTPRQVANAMPECIVAFGGDPGPCEGIKADLAHLYIEGAGLVSAEDAAEARAACRRLGINDLIATRWDPIWNANKGWVWTLPVVAETDNVRVVNCETDRSTTTR